jgi:hypothetical protein
MPAEVERDDINRIHERLDKIAEGQMAQAVAIARIEVQIAAIKPPPPLPARPCQDFEKHVEEHKATEKENRATWRGVLFEIAKPALAAVGGALAVVWGSGGR